MNKSFKKIWAILTVLALGTTTAFGAALPTDISGTSSETAIKALVEQGIVTGDTDGKFHPEDNLTRAQACTIIVKAIDPQTSLVNGTVTQSAGNKAGFSDLTGYKWASAYIAYAVEQGIVKGYPDGTFKPNVNVSTNEMLTMILRASGIKDEQIGGTYPDAYIERAGKEGVLAELGTEYPGISTKAMAAQMIYNKLDALRKNAPAEVDRPQGTKADVAKDKVNTEGMMYKEGKFDDDLTLFNGITLSKDIKIYTYGSKKEYSKTMKLPEKADAYRMDTVYKFKGAKTPAWYREENDKIVEMILPMDTGFTGNVYCVINDNTKDVGADGKATAAIETLTAMKKITWFAESGKDLKISETKDGTVYELRTSNGQVSAIGTADGGHKGKVFKELTGGSFKAVTEYEDGVITVEGGLIPVRTNASVYVWDDKAEEYRAGTLSGLRSGKQVRAYDVSDDDLTQADVVVVKM